MTILLTIAKPDSSFVSNMNARFYFSIPKEIIAPFIEPLGIEPFSN
jgi:hypothetical protein